MFGLGKKYRLICSNEFIGAKNVYRAGEKVCIYFNFIATDTNYYFYVDGERFNANYETGMGYVISFVMPEHDVEVIVEAKNSMLCFPDGKRETVLTFESFDGGGPEYTVKINDVSVVTYDQIKKYHNSDHENMCGSGCDVHITFFGLKEGKTSVTIECRSPIAENFDVIYDVTVNKALEITLTERERIEIN